jgi:hypothetical protein
MSLISTTTGGAQGVTSTSTGTPLAITRSPFGSPSTSISWPTSSTTAPLASGPSPSADTTTVDVVVDYTVTVNPTFGLGAYANQPSSNALLLTAPVTKRESVSQSSVDGGQIGCCGVPGKSCIKVHLAHAGDSPIADAEAAEAGQNIVRALELGAEMTSASVVEINEETSVVSTETVLV